MEVTPEVWLQLLGFAALGGIIWHRLKALEEGQNKLREDTSDSIDRLRSKIEEQNGRVDELEKWRERKEAWQRGWDERKEREEGPQHE